MASIQRKKGFAFYVRTAVSLALIYYVFRKAGLAELWQTVRRADPIYLVLSVSVTPVLILVSAWKWQIILRAHKIRVSLFRLFWLYVVGYFFNTVLPTNVGGDVVRAFALGKQTGKNAESFSSVFVERFTGLTALLFMAIVAFALAIRNLWDVWLFVALIVSVLGYFALLAMVLNPAIFRWVERHIKISLLKKVMQKLLKFQQALLSLRREKATLISAMAISFLFYLCAVLNVYVSALVFRANITFIDSVIITPIVLVITMIPISIGGIGLSEGAYFFTFSRMGLMGTIGLSVALLMRVKALLAGLFGGIYYSAMGIDIQQEMAAQSQEREVVQGDVQGEVNYFSSFEDIMRRKKSPLQKYQDIVMGTSSLWKLLKFEFVTFFFGPMPGVVGYFFRQIFYPLLFKAVGKGTAWGRNITLRHAHKISVGKRCVVDEYCMLSAQGDDSSGIALGNEVLLGRGTVVSTRNGTIEIGDFSNIGANCRLGTTSKIKFGKHVLLAANCYIGGAQHKFDRLDIPIMRQGYESKGGVLIEDDVWLGAGVTVLDGVTIGTGCVIGAGSIVTKDVPPYSIALGAPARVKASRKGNSLNSDRPAPGREAEL